ncbi:MAG: exodeoxyribonuclease VII large subunit [Streptosporangiaceae bacterium]
MGFETSPESPAPVRTVLNLVGGWIGKLGRIWVEGQITDLNRRGNSCYLTLRDPVANMSVRVVGSAAVFHNPAVVDGARVIIHARPDFYLNRGSFSLSAIEVRAVGVGELLARLERLKQVLYAEGLFRPERKRPLPFLPGRIGLICGRDSAAERDVLENARRRWPAVAFDVETVAVQGSHAVAEVVEALRRFDADPAIEVIIITRGGGSLEDLLPFSDETMVRAVAGARTPVVSAIGHEQDTPILDLVADLRASTPTDAAKKVVPDVREQMQLVRQLRDRGRRCMTGRVDRELTWLASVRSRPALADPIREVERKHEHLLNARDRARRALTVALDRSADRLSHTHARLTALSPAATLERGYAIVQREDASVVRSAASVEPGEDLLLRLPDGRIAAKAGPAV